MSVDCNQQLSKKQNVENDCHFSNKGEDIYLKYFNVPWPSLEAAMPIL
jgi:hypothetical protein